MNNNIGSGRKFSALQILLVVVLTIVMSVAITSWIILTDIFVTEFKPVVLNTTESQVLSDKLQILGVEEFTNDAKNNRVLKPERYAESDEKRVVSLTEKEVNALLAKNTDLADKR